MNQQNTPQQTPVTANITAGAVAKYALLPGILPRLKRLGFVLAKFLHVFTTLFGAAGLIPANHPCLRAENIGRYKFTEIVGLAAHNVRFSKDNIPQIIMFFAIIGAYLLTILTAILSVLQMVAGTQAHAQFFENPTTAPVATDMAYNFLTQVFGYLNVGDLWMGNNQLVPNNLKLNPMIFVFGEMMSFYSKMLLVVASFLIVYLLIKTVISAARTGRPWGEKFDSIWAPLRLAAAIGLLVPIHNTGYNGAQLMVFQFAHWGSAIATNLWTEGLTKGFANSQMVALSSPEPGYKIVRSVFLMEVCRAAYNHYNASAGLPEPIAKPAPTRGEKYVTFQYGFDRDPDYCGSFRYKIPVSSSLEDFNNIPVGMPGVSPVSGFDMNRASREVAIEYNRAVLRLQDTAEKFAKQIILYQQDNNQKMTPYDVPNQGQWHQDLVLKSWVDVLDTGGPTNGLTPSAVQGGARPNRSEQDHLYFNEKYWQDMRATYNKALLAAMGEQVAYGWANAGGFFLRISAFASKLSESFQQSPEVVSMPVLLANPEKPPNGENANEKTTKDALEKVANVLKTSDEWFKESPTSNLKTNAAPTTVPWQDYLRIIDYDGVWASQTASQTGSETTAGASASAGGLSSYFSSMNGYSLMDFGGDQDIHPIGEIAATGNQLMLTGGIMIAAGIYLDTMDDAAFFASFRKLSDLIVTIGGWMLLAGFMLSIVVPSIPFTYFAFSVIEWLASVLEAVIGMPLWCLSLISIEGEGLGKAQTGFNTMIELMLRPAIIVISLIACAILYTGAIRFFMLAYGTFTDDDAGTGKPWFQVTADNDPFLGLMHMLLYMFMIYGLTTSIFKLMNQIPDGFFRWAQLQADPLRTKMGAEMSQQYGAKLAGEAVGMTKGVAKAAGQQGAEMRAAYNLRHGTTPASAQFRQNEQTLRDAGIGERFIGSEDVKKARSDNARMKSEMVKSNVLDNYHVLFPSINSTIQTATAEAAKKAEIERRIQQDKTAMGAAFTSASPAEQARMENELRTKHSNSV